MADHENARIACERHLYPTSARKRTRARVRVKVRGLYQYMVKILSIFKEEKIYKKKFENVKKK